jgi:TolB-like protein
MGVSMPPDDVRAELARVLASDQFVNSDRLSRFLRFVVEKTLAGEADAIKEYPIGVEVFDRGATFDPRLDPVVRVEARRLRAKLAEYYDGPGRDAPLRIIFRKGSYVPGFEPAAAAPTPVSAPRAGRRLLWVSVGLALAAAVATGAYWVANQPNRPVVAVLPMPIRDGQPQAAVDLLQGVAESLTAELARTQNIQVVSWPAVVEHLRRHASDPAGAAATELHANYVVAISVRMSAGRARIIAHLVNPAVQRKAWATDYERPLDGDLLATQRELARAVADELRPRLARVRER